MWGEFIMSRTLRLETKRLILRTLELNDAPAVSYNSNRPSVAAEMSDMILPDKEAGLNWIIWINSKSNVEEPWQVLAIERKSDHRCIGLVGVIPQEKINREIEILFEIADEYQNNGFATEAAKELIRWFFETRHDTYLCAIVKVNNLASQRVIEKIGFEYMKEREIVYDNNPTLFKYYQLKEINLE
ncbi:MAG: putative acetyltransferase, gnat family [Herbinix sp.]|jgi:RimJ/RimL family protein N-acetyltransferase|nr:putative acetyltransferase, gnat family [Herbinix sp.]